MLAEVTIELHTFGANAPDQARRLLALGMPGDGFYILRPNAALLGRRSATFENYRFTLWATVLDRDVDLQDSPWYRLANSRVSMTFQSWLQEVQYGDSSVYGEVLWLPGVGRTINIRGLEHAKSKQDVDVAWRGLQVLEHHPTLGRPSGSGQYQDRQKFCQAFDKALTAILARAPLTICQSDVANEMKLADDRELRRLLQWAGMNWKKLKPY